MHLSVSFYSWKEQQELCMDKYYGHMKKKAYSDSPMDHILYIDIKGKPGKVKYVKKKERERHLPGYWQ